MPEAVPAETGDAACQAAPCQVARNEDGHIHSASSVQAYRDREQRGVDSEDEEGVLQDV